MPGTREQNQHDKDVEEFLAKGGEIQKFGYGERTENLETSYSFYGRRKKPAATAATADAKKPAKKK